MAEQDWKRHDQGPRLESKRSFPVFGREPGNNRNDVRGRSPLFPAREPLQDQGKRPEEVDREEEIAAYLIGPNNAVS